MCGYVYIYIWRYLRGLSGSYRGVGAHLKSRSSALGLYKIVVHLLLSVQESSIPSLHVRFALPTLLQYNCATFAQYVTPPPTLPVDAIPHIILVMTISSKG